MLVSKMIEELQKLDPNLDVMVSLSDCEIISPVSYVEESYARPDERTGLHCEVEWDEDSGEEKPKDPRAEKIVMLGYTF